jgi:hypothetical protein
MPVLVLDRGCRSSTINNTGDRSFSNPRRPLRDGDEDEDDMGVVVAVVTGADNTNINNTVIVMWRRR